MTEAYSGNPRYITSLITNGDIFVRRGRAPRGVLASASCLTSGCSASSRQAIRMRLGFCNPWLPHGSINLNGPTSIEPLLQLVPGLHLVRLCPPPPPVLSNRPLCSKSVLAIVIVLEDESDPMLLGWLLGGVRAISAYGTLGLKTPIKAGIH